MRSSADNWKLNKRKGKRYTKAERQAYWMGVGAGMGSNLHGISYYDMRRALTNKPGMSDSFSAGFSRSYEMKKLPKKR